MSQNLQVPHEDNFILSQSALEVPLVPASNLERINRYRSFGYFHEQYGELYGIPPGFNPNT